MKALWEKSRNAYATQLPANSLPVAEIDARGMVNAVPTKVGKKFFNQLTPEDLDKAADALADQVLANIKIELPKKLSATQQQYAKLALGDYAANVTTALKAAAVDKIKVALKAKDSIKNFTGADLAGPATAIGDLASAKLADLMSKKVFANLTTGDLPSAVVKSLSTDLSGEFLNKVCAGAE